MLKCSELKWSELKWLWWEQVPFKYCPGCSTGQLFNWVVTYHGTPAPNEWQTTVFKDWSLTVQLFSDANSAYIYSHLLLIKCDCQFYVAMLFENGPNLRNHFKPKVCKNIYWLHSMNRLHLCLFSLEVPYYRLLAYSYALMLYTNSCSSHDFERFNNFDCVAAFSS